MKKLLSLSLAFLLLLTNTVSAGTGGTGNSQAIESEVSSNSATGSDNMESISKSVHPKKRGGSSGNKKIWVYVIGGVFVVILVLFVAAGGTPTVSVGA